MQYPSGRAGNYDSAPTTFIIATNSFLAFAARSATDGRLFSMGASRVGRPARYTPRQRQRGPEVVMQQQVVMQHQTNQPCVCNQLLLLVVCGGTLNQRPNFTLRTSASGKASGDAGDSDQLLVNYTNRTITGGGAGP